MTKPTFQNLPAHRQDTFTQAALTEFAQHTYNDASVSRIVRTLGMAKGSFYQYFTDKKALYFYLKDQAEAKKRAQLEAVLRQDHADFWELYRQLYVSGIQFELDYPLHSTFLYNFSQEKALPETEALLQAQFGEGIVFFRDIFVREQQQGQLAAHLDPELMAYVIMQVGRGLGDWIAWKHNVQLTADPAPSAAPPGRDALLRTVEEIIQLLQFGMHP